MSENTDCSICKNLKDETDGCFPSDGFICVAPFDSPVMHMAMLDRGGIGCEYFESKKDGEEMIGGCEGLACSRARDLEKKEREATEDRLYLSNKIRDIKTMLKLGNIVAAYQTCEEALK